MAHWKRLGRIFTADDGPEWMASHASHPVAVPLPESSGAVRIYFTSRSPVNKSQIAWVDCHLQLPCETLAISKEPVFGAGCRGSFDDCGTTTSWITGNDAVSFHYFIGWNVRNTVPFHNSIGLTAIREANRPGEPPIVKNRWAGPVLDRNLDDPFFCSSPCVVKAGAQWLMWYISGTGWQGGDESTAASYVIKRAESENGIQWHTSTDIALDVSNPDEVALARPCVLHDETGWHMWFCYRGTKTPYRIGYAHSTDGKLWTRDDKSNGLTPSAAEWESDMVCYPFVFDYGANRYMLYCGNGYGRTGFGLAIWET